MSGLIHRLIRPISFTFATGPIFPRHSEAQAKGSSTLTLTLPFPPGRLLPHAWVRAAFPRARRRAQRKHPAAASCPRPDTASAVAVLSPSTLCSPRRGRLRPHFLPLPPSSSPAVAVTVTSPPPPRLSSPHLRCLSLDTRLPRSPSPSTRDRRHLHLSINIHPGQLQDPDLMYGVQCAAS